jgi:hypothetical protein
MREALAGTDLYEVAAPHQSANGKLAKNASTTLSYTGAPDLSSGAYSTCAASTAGCRSVCVLSNACGYAAIEERAGLGSIMRARARRVIVLREHPVAAGVELVRAAARAARISRGTQTRAVARLNVGTDLAWEAIPDVDSMLGRFGIASYAYTKRPNAVRAALRHGGRTRIVYSWSECASEALASEYLGAGGTVAVVFAGLGAGQYKRPMPRAFTLGGRSWRCIDGDATDDRTRDPRGVVVALRGKGPLASVTPARLAKANQYGFAIDPDDPRAVW